MTDMINPSHYRGDRKFEPIDVIEDWGLNYRLGNALKYISRNGRKPGEDPAEGLRKAIWYLEREVASLEPSQPYQTTYEDVLEDFAACAAEGENPIFEYGNWGAAQEVPFDATEDVLSFDLGDDGPVGSEGTDNLFGSDTFFVASDRIEKEFEDAINEAFIDFGDYEPYNNGNSINLRKKSESFNWDSDDDFMFQTARVYEGNEEDKRKFWEELDIAAVENVWVKLTDEEIADATANKDLEQFEDDEIVTTIFRRGLIIGVRKNGSTCLLGENGRCLDS